MRFIPSKIHAFIDYIVCTSIVLCPWWSGFYTNETAAAVMIVLGLGGIVYSLFTNYELGVFKKLSMSTHLILDAASGFILMISPWIFGFSNDVYLPFVLFGVFEIIASLISEKKASSEAPFRIEEDRVRD